MPTTNYGFDSYRSAFLKMFLCIQNTIRDKELWLNDWKKPANPKPLLEIYVHVSILKMLRWPAIKNVI